MEIIDWSDHENGECWFQIISKEGKIFEGFLNEKLHI